MAAHVSHGLLPLQASPMSDVDQDYALDPRDHAVLYRTQPTEATKKVAIGDRNFICHRLALDKGVRPVVQPLRKLNTEKTEAVRVEVDKLLKAKFIREIQYPTWLANVVMVLKPNKQWRMCTDYTSLNRHCPKDYYPLPNIDKLVDGASGHGWLSLMD